MAPFGAGNGAVARVTAERHIRRNDGLRSDAVCRIAAAAYDANNAADDADALEHGDIEDSLADADTNAFVFFFAKLDGISSPNSVSIALFFFRFFLFLLSRLLFFNLYVSRKIPFSFAFGDGRLGVPSG